MNSPDIQQCEHIQIGDSLNNMNIRYENENENENENER